VGLCGEEDATPLLSIRICSVKYTQLKDGLINEDLIYMAKPHVTCYSWWHKISLISL